MEQSVIIDADKFAQRHAELLGEIEQLRKRRADCIRMNTAQKDRLETIREKAVVLRDLRDEGSRLEVKVAIEDLLTAIFQ